MKNWKYSHTGHQAGGSRSWFPWFRFLCFLCLFSFLTGCSSPSLPAEAMDGAEWKEDWTLIGTTLGIEALDNFTLAENNGTLAAEGLYYATWVTGSSVPYENSDGDTIELYDAQIYLLLNETTNHAAAERNQQRLFTSAEDTYKILSREDITCNGQAYTLLTYDCVSEDSPYVRGVCALGICGTDSIWAELTCVEGYEDDLMQLLIDFLNTCHYSIRLQEN